MTLQNIGTRPCPGATRAFLFCEDCHSGASPSQLSGALELVGAEGGTTLDAQGNFIHFVIRGATSYMPSYARELQLTMVGLSLVNGNGGAIVMYGGASLLFSGGALRDCQAVRARARARGHVLSCPLCACVCVCLLRSRPA